MYQDIFKYNTMNYSQISQKRLEKKCVL